MKNKRLLAILIVFVFVCTVAVLSGAVFTVSDIQVRLEAKGGYLISTDEVTQTEEEISSKLSFALNSNIFFSLNRKKIKAVIEEEFIEVKYLSIDIELPNRIIVKVRERFPVFELATSDTHIVLDGYLRVIDTDPDSDVFKHDPIDVSGQVNLDKEKFSAIKEGDYLHNYIEGYSEIESENTADMRRVDVLSQIFPFFEAYDQEEDSLRKYFGEIRFGNLMGTFVVMFKQNIENPAQEIDGDYYIVQIEEADKDFARKLESAWLAINHDVIEHKSGAFVVTQEPAITNKRLFITEWRASKSVGWDYILADWVSLASEVIR